MKRYDLTAFDSMALSKDGAWVYYEDVLKRIPAYEPPPCECCEKQAAVYVSRCYCGNPGDHAAAVRWCTRMEIADSFEAQQ